VIWIGTYAAKGGAGLESLASANGSLYLGPAEARIVNASFGVWSAQRGIAYFVDERDEGCISAWGRQNGTWIAMGDTESGGSAPCYLSISPDGTRLAVANYGDGTLALIDLDPETGANMTIRDRFQPRGRGPDPDRQDGPHAHCALFGEDGRAIYHVDLGLDRVFRHRLDGQGIADTQIAFEAPAGYGPRHFLFHPDGVHALLLCELAAELLLLRRQGPGFQLVEAVPTAPEPGAAKNLGGHLAIDASGAVWVSNRGHDSLVEFRLEKGRLVRQRWFATGSASPRHFLFAGSAILIAHEEGENVTRLDLSGRAETSTQTVTVPGAAFLIDTAT
jgi:6-phosphogluconolactonase